MTNSIPRNTISISCLIALQTQIGCSDPAPVDPIPTDLANIEGAAEKAVDGALNNDKAAVTTQAQIITTTWTSFRPQAVTAGAPSGALTTLDAAVAGLNTTIGKSDATSLELARAANAISAPMSQLFETYRPKIPTSLLNLDYLGREVQFDARAADFVRAGTDLTRIEQGWATLKPDTVSNGGATDAAQMDKAISDCRAGITAGNAASVETAALLELEIVDAIEGIYAKKIDQGD
jgi:hypothetical protein